ncbi:MAG: hypothetical protein A3H52_03050 [Candidatus Zambryskibacteria bacterium RIFCSPLOWO2_02_FULL_39_26]|uniref:B12-binding domain-containing protein n=1 Tax=Candidatus Zambryskibacteria bacterium RIFCSPLOWO2_12_FULL_39_23 TaxID=1802776 RepID=A0A1G2UTR1_9BACT|nr:MAG: hypothetical protein A3E59_02225 [Candidatus Zambryskibacteria bacterium RIFCSPHIGHO2_12_FULL_39_47]OHB10564.1 MAG: hypothetical protein A3H52_03050 [Candidatus Zambryskibacteria bacterium RIFCSPLOWO2_02_FULL_39_26]OHB12777.1 MAG: hypothetical protein A3G99_01350 [Candidatus Zambryskibacteria bacterium RIFCSPLOWO2_12_FULL_39_23]
MNRKRNVQLVQVNYQYGQNVFVPYSVGSLQAYAETVPEIRNSFNFQEPLFLREDPVSVVRNMKNPTVVGFSCYLWNWEYNTTLARAVREAFPKALIVFGGTQVPNASDGFFEKYPCVDILVHHEGELPFADILQESLSASPDYTSITGLSVRVEGVETLKTLSRERVKDLSILPSPYLAGIFDFMLGRGFSLNVSQETNRGCPYSCTFCDWGGATYSKMFSIDIDRILAEFDWFGRNKAEYLFNCDANYGILPRDHDLTMKMVETRARYNGYPKRFRMCTAKNSNDKIFEIVKILSDVGMNKGATLSFQSMDEGTLTIVKRRNIKITQFSHLMDRYREAGIATYTELILAMPGESYQSTKDGIDTLIDGQDDNVNIYVYPCTALPNSEMSDPRYVEVHQIKSVRMPILLAHSTPEPESLTEYSEAIVETSTMSREDWCWAYMFYWAVQGFHCLGLTQHIAIFFHKFFGLKYSDFYEKLVNYFTENKETFIGEEVALTWNIVRAAQGGGRLDRILPRFGNIYWPLEEATFLNLITYKEKSYGEIRGFLNVLVRDLGLGEIDPVLLDDVVLYASSRIIGPNLPPVSIELHYNLHEYLSRLRDPSVRLEKMPMSLTIKAETDFGGDLERYAKEVVWYGRKGGKFHHPVV